MNTNTDNNDTALPEQSELEMLHHRVQELDKTIEQYKSDSIIQAALYKIANIASSSQNMLCFYEALHKIIASLTIAKNCFVAVIDKEQQYVSFPYYKDETISRDPSITVPIEDFKKTLTGTIFCTGKMLHADYNALRAMRESRKVIVYGDSTTQDWLGVPLKQDDKVLGALVIQSYELNFCYSKQDEDLLTYISKHISTALLRKQADEELKASHHNLQRINQQLEREVKTISAENIKLKAIAKEHKAI